MCVEWKQKLCNANKIKKLLTMDGFKKEEIGIKGRESVQRKCVCVWMKCVNKQNKEGKL